MVALEHILIISKLAIMAVMDDIPPDIKEKVHRKASRVAELDIAWRRNQIYDKDRRPMFLAAQLRQIEQHEKHFEMLRLDDGDSVASIVDAGEKAATAPSPTAGQAERTPSSVEAAGSSGTAPTTGGEGHVISTPNAAIEGRTKAASSKNSMVLDFEPTTVTFLLLLPLLLHFYVSPWLYVPIGLLAITYFQVMVLPLPPLQLPLPQSPLPLPLPLLLSLQLPLSPPATAIE